jgi:hypothetical protein
MDKIHICFHKDYKKRYEMKMIGHENDSNLLNIHKNNGLNHWQRRVQDFEVRRIFDYLHTLKE